MQHNAVGHTGILLEQHVFGYGQVDRVRNLQAICRFVLAVDATDGGEGNEEVLLAQAVPLRDQVAGQLVDPVDRADPLAVPVVHRHAAEQIPAHRLEVHAVDHLGSAIVAIGHRQGRAAALHAGRSRRQCAELAGQHILAQIQVDLARVDAGDRTVGDVELVVSDKADVHRQIGGGKAVVADAADLLAARITHRQTRP